LLIDAAPRIVQERPNTTFVIVGDGRERRKLESLTRERNLRQHFVFPGHVPYEDLPKYISAFDVALILWPTERMESLGSSAIKLGEYLACARPVVASSGDGHEFLEENGLGWLVVPEEPEQVAKTICIALDTPEAEKESMGERARAFVDAYLSTVSLAHRRYELWTRSIGTRGRCER
jgi:glycosyltransferase involved in cell wall biosynthesis